MKVSKQLILNVLKEQQALSETSPNYSKLRKYLLLIDLLNKHPIVAVPVAELTYPVGCGWGIPRFANKGKK